jgi:type IX secretion system PorP/SprF family membrane protein
MRKTLQQLLLLLGLSSSVLAQDIHFSQIHASPTLLNPAMTGLTNADMRFTANTKSQWNSVTNAYRTIAGSMDMKIGALPTGDIIGGGLTVISDKAGDLDFTTNTIGLSVSYMKTLDKGKNFVSFGMTNALVSSSVDFSSIVAFDIEPSIQDGALNNMSYWDVSAGIGWFHNFNDRYAFHVGASIFHLNRPDISFYDDGTDVNGQLLYRKFTIHGTGEIEVSKQSIIKPSFIYADQGPHKEITLGSFWKYKTSKDKKQDNPTAIYFGGWMRWYAEKGYIGKDAFIGAVRIDYKNTFMTFTFDVNISSLSNVTYGAGGPEFSIIQLVDFRNDRLQPRKVECPALSY